MTILRWLNSSGIYKEVSASDPLPVNATVNASAAALVGTSAPTYNNGETQPLSMTTAGALRISGTISASTSATATTAAPSYVNGTDNNLSQNLTGDLRTIAKMSGTWTVGIDQTTPGTTNAVDVTNFPLTVDVNSGSKSNNTIRVVLATDQPQNSNAFKVDGSAVTQPVSGTFWQATQPVSASSLPLPTGAATAAKQPALGTAGSASADVISVQGVASMTALKVDGSGVTQPVSGTFWQATQPVSFTMPALVAGTAVIGKVGIDQTTDGTTNLVAAKQNGTWTVGISASQTIGVTNLPTTVDTNSGNKSASTLRVILATDQPSLSNALAVSQSGTWNVGTITTITGITTAFGATAANVPANAVQSGVRAATANPTAVTDGQLAGVMADKVGRQVVVNSGVRDLITDGSGSATGTTETDIIAAGGASVFLDMLSLVLANTGATAVDVTIRDVAAGSARFNIYVPAGDTRGIVFQTPFKQTTANNKWTFQSGGSTTTLKVTGQFVKNL